MKSALTFSERKEMFERRSKMISAYIAFLVALLIAIFAKVSDYPRSWIVISLVAVLLPSLVAYLFLDWIVLIKQGRRNSTVRGAASALGFLPSILAIGIFIGQFSKLAGILFLVLTILWVVAIDLVVYRGQDRGTDI